MATKPGFTYLSNLDTLLVLLDGTPITEFPSDSPAVETRIVDTPGQAVRGLAGCWAPTRDRVPRRLVRLTVLPNSVSDSSIQRLAATAASRRTAQQIHVFFGDLATSAARVAIAQAFAAAGGSVTPSNATGLLVSGYVTVTAEPERSLQASESALATWEFEGVFPIFAVGSLVPARPLTRAEIDAFTSPI